MFDFLKHKPAYKKRGDGKKWTKNQAIKAIAEEFGSLHVTVRGNVILVPSVSALSVEFISSNFSDPGELELNGSIFFKVGNQEVMWEDLFSYAKGVYGERYRGLHLYRDEEWEGSRLQKECREAYLPLLSILVDEKKRGAFLNGQEVQYKGKAVVPPYTDLNVLRKQFKDL